MDDQLTTSPPRKIIDDFAKEITNKKRAGSKPLQAVIHFRNEHIINKEREIVEVPIELLRFRKDNGRISSDVLSYEKNKEVLLEESKKAQDILRGFLENKDPEKTTELTQSIKHTGQQQPAIITADGFLINGNRRKMALDNLFYNENNETFKWMKVVILPGKNEEGGPPTLKEIEQIENRYQLQSEGKSEYYNFDRALSIRRKIAVGMSVEEQLKDDPKFADLSQKDFKKEVKRYTEEFLAPLECIDEYLETLGRSGLYDTVSTGISDREGRWQAFLDFSKFKGKLDNGNKRRAMCIEEDEIGDVLDVAYKIIRQREFPGTKAHYIMRDLEKFFAKKDAKKELLKLKDIPWQLPREENYDKDGNEHSEKEKDKRWSAIHQQTLINQVRKAQRIFDRDIELETPLTLLEAALKKLTHDNMNNIVRIADLPKARQLASKVRDKAAELEKEFYRLKKDGDEKSQQIQKKFSR